MRDGSVTGLHQRGGGRGHQGHAESLSKKPSLPDLAGNCGLPSCLDPGVWEPSFRLGGKEELTLNEGSSFNGGLGSTPLLASPGP